MHTYSVLELFKLSGFQIAAVCICSLCLYFTFARNYAGKLHNRIFAVIVLNILLSAIFDIVCRFIEPFSASSPALKLIQNLSLFLYFFLHAMLSPLFCFYIVLVTGFYRRLNRKLHYLYELPTYVAEICVLTNPLTHWVYSYDKNHLFIRNSGEQFLYLIGILYFLASAVMVLFLWRSINGNTKKTLAYFYILVAVGTLLQLTFQGLQTELFAEALAMIGVMTTLENEDNRKDSRTGIYTIQAFCADIQSLLRSNTPFGLICIKMSNPQGLMQLVGQRNIESLTMITAGHLAEVVPKYTIYYTNPGTFLILDDEQHNRHTHETARTLSDRFQNEWAEDALFHAEIFYAEIPEHLQSFEQIMALVNSPVTAVADRKKDVYSGEDLHIFVRSIQVQQALLNGLKDNNFEVYYYPIYDMKDMSICAGQAMLRLHDTQIGDIYPEEFLPVAERTGTIFELENYVLDEICKFINSGIPVEMGVHSIHIILSMIQCLRPGYAEQIIERVSRYNIAPEHITFEIVGSATIADMESLFKFVTPLREYGFYFSLDDFGVSFSNMHSLFNQCVDHIRLDCSILSEAVQSEQAHILLAGSVDLINRIGKKLLITGVSSKEQVELAEKMGVDYLQGSYFSPPVTQNAFIGILKATRLARLEEQRALAANEAMSAFLANMSHEIRTPINAVLGMDEMILRESGDDRILEYARNIKGAGKTLLSLINDILDFSKIEAGNMDIVETDYDLRTVLHDVVNMIRLKTEEKNLSLMLDVDPTIPCKLHGDGMRLGQIMLNLLNNAIKYTLSGTITLHVSGNRSEDAFLNLQIAVEDTGIGIKEEDLDKLFQKFQRLDPARNNTIEGSGLGLAITKQLLDLMKGKISVESTYGKGSCFTVRLSQRIVEELPLGDLADQLSNHDHKNTSYQEPFHTHDARILVVDDTRLNLIVIQELLKQTGLAVDTATNGPDCLELIAANAYDIIFLDYRMPEMDGIETLKRIKALPDHPNLSTPVIALTANAILGAREQFLKEGFDDYMTKPVDAEKLEKLLLNYLPAEKVEQMPAPPLDTEQGISNCSDPGTYQTFLQAFLDEIPDKASELRQAYETKDWESYMIHVHAIKSSARIVGATELSQLALELEEAADNLDIARIEADHNRLLVMYESYLKLNTEEDPDVPDDLPLLTEAMWQDACQALQAYCHTYDLDNALRIIKTLETYALPDDKKQSKKQMKKYITSLQWDVLSKMLDTILQ